MTRKHFKDYLFLHLFVLSSFLTYSQIDFSRDVVASSGTVYENSNIKMSFTIGEPMTATFENSLVFTQGFQQGDLSTVSVHELSGETLTLFPNPANKQITLVSSLNSPFEYRVHDVTGRLVMEGGSSLGTLSLNVEHLVEGKYFIEYSPKSGIIQHIPFITIH